jgi:hypothetical protein
MHGPLNVKLRVLIKFSTPILSDYSCTGSISWIMYFITHIVQEKHLHSILLHLNTYVLLPDDGRIERPKHVEE